MPALSASQPFITDNHQPETETVMVVEDNRVEQVRLEAMLSKFGYRVVSADDGEQALALLEKHPVKLIVSDWRMPRITGIDLCRTLKGDPAYGSPYVVLVTGRNTKSDLVAGMDAGADDFITKPFNSEELRVRLQAGARIVRLRDEIETRNEQLRQTMERETAMNETIRRDLEAAARAQQELLPNDESPFEQIEVASLFMPAVEVTGDTYNFFRLDDEHLAFYHIDVSGHGIASAMLSFTLSHTLRSEMGLTIADNTAGSDILDPSIVVDKLNKRFAEKRDCHLYFTMVYGYLNVRTGRGRLCQAGHPHPLACGSERPVSKLGNGGFPVGMLEQATYEDTDFELSTGDRLVLYSDGVTDITNSEGEAFGTQRLMKLMACSGGCNPQSGMITLSRLLKRWNGEDAALDDDISMLVIARNV